MSILEKINRLFKHKLDAKEAFRNKYQYFQNLLASNDEALEKMAILSEMLNQRGPFAYGKGRKLIAGILEDTRNIIQNLQLMCQDHYSYLWKSFEQICLKEQPFIHSQSAGKTLDDHVSQLPYSIDLSRVNIHNINHVGGKMARLGEIKNVLGMPVPEGVCITSRCFEEFLTENDLREKIDDITSSLDLNNSVELQEASRAIQAMLVSAPISPDIEEEILKAYDRLCQRVGEERLLAVRSSAVGEDDPRHSFAGLHYTALNVSRQNLVDACWEVLISKYLPQSMAYRFITGLRDMDMPMNIGCMEMLNPRVSGTLFTVDPQKKKPGMIIQAVRGIGSLVVEGKVLPQEIIVERGSEAQVLCFNPGNQSYLLRPRCSDGLDQEKFSVTDSQDQFLTEEEIKLLVGYGLTIEAHFGIPQDIEWSVDQNGRIYILQTRPLQVVSPEMMRSIASYPVPDLKKNYPVLAEGGDCACQGVGSGSVFIATQERFLVDFPDGGILVARKTSPAYARVLHKASAVVTEIGSTTGHLSIIARELGVPTILNVDDVTYKLKSGQQITVDANHGIIFAGQVPELNSSDQDLTKRASPFHSTPIYKMLNKASEYILPLNLTDPQADSFVPQHCKTAHDITRFCHEIAIHEMFNLNDTERQKVRQVRKLIFDIPLEVYVIDLGGGLNVEMDSRKVKIDEIISQPFRAMLEGMNTPGIPWSGPVPVDLRGFAGLILNTMVDSGRTSRELGSHCYSLISKQYVNFSARMGYHFSSLDAYASSSINRNYISYRFKGGAADTSRRERRAKFIAFVLRSYGFHVVQRSDHVHATIRKLEQVEILRLLKDMGRLLGAVRNADVTMYSDELIQLYAQAFLSGSSSPVETMKNKNNKTRQK